MINIAAKAPEIFDLKRKIHLHATIEIFELLLANCARSFERLPCVEDVDLLRNILYSGVWLKYHCKNAKKKDKTA
jgi:hypothetical protein